MVVTGASGAVLRPMACSLSHLTGKRGVNTASHRSFCTLQQRILSMVQQPRQRSDRRLSDHRCPPISGSPPLRCQQKSLADFLPPAVSRRTCGLVAKKPQTNANRAFEDGLQTTPGSRPFHRCCGQALPSVGETAGQPMNTHFSTSEDSVQPESAEAFWPA